MGKVIADISMSLDGFIAGPHPTSEEPLGKGGEKLHEWGIKTAGWRKSHNLEGGEKNIDSDIIEESITNNGAVIMGRRMFSGGSGPWETDSNADGWWGSNPPFHAPVYILTTHARGKVEKEGGTSFNFVTEGIESAMSQAKSAAGDKNILIAGGANVIQQFITAGYVDELWIHVVPVLLGGGTPLLVNLGDIKLQKTKVVDSQVVTHFRFNLKT